MHIAFMLTSLGIGGRAVCQRTCRERMTRRGHSVHMIVLRERRPERWRDSDSLAAAMVAVMRTPQEALENQGLFARVRIEELCSMNSKTAEWQILHHSSVAHPHGR